MTGPRGSGWAAAPARARARRPWRSSWRVGLLCWVAFLAAAPGCEGEVPEPSRALLELERLAFVPATGGGAPAGTSASFVQRVVDLTLERPLLVDRFELTRRQAREFGLDTNAEAPPFVSDAARTTAETLDWPAFLTFAQAEELARRRGMRLPTPAEWLHVATDGGRLLYPYHALISQKGFANTRELGLGSPAPVGSFENGRSRLGCYDLHGNVAEWVDGAVPGHDDPAPLQDLAAETEPTARLELASVMGGSYQTDARTSFRRAFGRIPLTFYARLVDKRSLRPAVGARHVADAGGYLVARADAWGSDAASLARVRTVGRVWAEAAGRARVAPFLAELAASHPESAGLRALSEGASGEAQP